MIWNKIFSEKTSKVREIKYFSESGKVMPSGATYQKGAFLVECRRNSKKFVTEGIAGEQYGLSNYRGGVIVFATSVNSVEMSKNAIVNKAKQLWTSFLNAATTDKKLNKCIDSYNKDDDNANDLIGAFSVGNAFKGKYVDIDTGKVFNDRSYTIEIGGLSSRGLLNLAERIANEFLQQTVLVKDFNNNKMYLADGVASEEEPDFSKVNSMVSESQLGIEYLSDIISTCEQNGIMAIADDVNGEIYYYDPKKNVYATDRQLRDAEYSIDELVQDPELYDSIMNKASGDGFKEFSVAWNGLEKKGDDEEVYKTKSCAPIHGNFNESDYDEEFDDDGASNAVVKLTDEIFTSLDVDAGHKYQLDFGDSGDEIYVTNTETNECFTIKVTQDE